MAPIRVGLIGLSSTVVQGLAPGRWGRQHLNSLLPSPKYRIVALCNSSIDSARKAIAVNNLPLETMAYGSPDDMARDPDVDLVVVCVRVGKHLAIAKPALLHKKDILVEWPLGASIAEVEELANLAKEAGVKTAVGVQSRADPVVRKLRELISTGAVGEVVSSMMWVGSNMIVPDSWQEGTEYFLDINSGGSLFQILFGHGEQVDPAPWVVG
jgi:predicted dehydrogenase